MAYPWLATAVITAMLALSPHRPVWGETYDRPVPRETEASRRTRAQSCGTEYECLIADAERQGLEAWEYVALQPGLRKANVLLKHGHTANDVVGDEPVLVGAIEIGRFDLVEWLLKRGADPNPPGPDAGEPLEEALESKDGRMAAALLAAGADPQPHLHAMEAHFEGDPKRVRLVIGAMIRRLGEIPEEFVQNAVATRDGVALDVLLESGRPVQRDVSYWQNGKPAAVPPVMLMELASKPAVVTKLRKVYARAKPPKDRVAALVYGMDRRGWHIIRYGSSPTPDDELLLFGTSFCVHFANGVPCGSSEQLSRAREWVSGLALPCEDPRLAGKLDGDACTVAMYYATLANRRYDEAVLISSLSDSYFLSRSDLRVLYAEKHASSADKAVRESLRAEALALLEQQQLPTPTRVDMLRATAVSRDKRREPANAEVDADLMMLVQASERFSQMADPVGAVEAIKLAIQADRLHSDGSRILASLISRDLDVNGLLSRGEAGRLEPVAFAAATEPSYGKMRRPLVRGLYELKGFSPEQLADSKVTRSVPSILNLLKALEHVTDYQDENLPRQWRWRPTLVAALTYSRESRHYARREVDAALAMIREMPDPATRTLAWYEAFTMMSAANYDDATIKRVARELLKLTNDVDSSAAREIRGAVAGRAE